MKSPIKKQPFLYRNFLKNSVIYRQNEAYWARWVEKTLTPYAVCPTPWLNKCYGDGTAICDGNPIYDALLNNNKALRIIQIEPESETLYLSAWIDTTEGNEGEELQELVIHIQLTRKTRAKALLLVEKWVTVKERFVMERFIKELLG